MTYFDESIKLNIFEPETIYKTDFCNMGHVARKLYTWPKDRSEKPEKPQPAVKCMDNETHQLWREGVHVPFNLMWQRKPITGIDPHSTFTIPDKILDNKREESMKTRPRLYVSPAVSIDDVPDPEMRQLMCQHMYTTDWRKAVLEAAWPTTKRLVSNTTVEKDIDPVGLKLEVCRPLEGKWRSKGKQWDLQQKRSYVDPTCRFWLKKDPPMKCGACVNPYKGLVTQSTKDKLAKLIKEDKLRLAHDIPSPSYAGYKPHLSAGVSLEKVETPVTHPLMTCSQAITSRYAGQY